MSGEVGVDIHIAAPYYLLGHGHWGPTSGWSMGERGWRDPAPFLLGRASEKVHQTKEA